MPDNQAQKTPNASQPAGSQDQKKPEAAPKDDKSSYAGDNKTENKGGAKSSTSGSSTGSR